MRQGDRVERRIDMGIALDGDNWATGISALLTFFTKDPDITLGEIITPTCHSQQELYAACSNGYDNWVRDFMRKANSSPMGMAIPYTSKAN
jgi:hypothetical protein